MFNGNDKLFEITNLEIRLIFVQMGMGDMFDSRADLRELLESPEKLFVSHVVHKAFIEINEEYTEAAAATSKSFV